MEWCITLGVIMNLTKLEQEWKEQGKHKEFLRLVKNKNESDETLDRVFSQRTELFQKMNIEDEDEQRHLIDLINNVVWERQVSLKSTKTDLELCFTPHIRERLDGEDK